MSAAAKVGVRATRRRAITQTTGAPARRVRPAAMEAVA